MTAQLVCGDCRDILPTLADASVDAVITDPPFGIGYEYDDYDDDPTQYDELMRFFVPQAERICNGGPIFVWQAMSNADKWHRWFPPGFRLFAACKSFVQYRPVGMQYSWDPVVFWGEIRNEPSVYNKDYYEQRMAPFGKDRVRIEHPCPRPLEQVRAVILRATRPGDLVLDPFMGSGMIGVACIQTGRRYIGIELRPKYFEVAEKQLATARCQPPLFVPEPQQLKMAGVGR